jgi:hypothetical protein
MFLSTIEEVYVMRRFVAMCLLVIFMGWGSAAYAEDSECDCDCKNGGLGIKLSNFVCGFGFKYVNSKLGCDKNIGIGLGVGSELHRVQLGSGYNEGLFGFGLGFKGPEKTTSVGFSVGWDYGDCRMIFPYEE